MHNLILAAAVTIAAVASTTLANTSANAAGFVFEGHKHCWYADGWHGSGWYWCGYARRKGHGWGGPEGWQGWKH
jgi:hypothetical protein